MDDYSVNIVEYHVRPEIELECNCIKCGTDLLLDHVVKDVGSVTVYDLDEVSEDSFVETGTPMETIVEHLDDEIALFVGEERDDDHTPYSIPFFICRDCYEEFRAEDEDEDEDEPEDVVRSINANARLFGS